MFDFTTRIYIFQLKNEKKRKINEIFLILKDSFNSALLLT